MTTVYYIQPGQGAEPILSERPSGIGRIQPVVLEYMNEGNANVIFRIRSPSKDADLPSSLKDKLLRLRKDKSFIRPTKEQHAALRTHFVPLFNPPNLIEQDLVRIGQDLANTLNKLLQQLESSGDRLKSRHEDVLATNELYGLIMTDMTAQPGEIQLELKPKWLVQSPDAPKHARRCRTCALRARRRHIDRPNEGGSFADKVAFCPLGLLSGDARERRRVFEVVARRQDHIDERTVQDAITTLSKQILPVLTELRSHQARLDKHGILTLDPKHIPQDYLKAMTLRDCVLLIKGSSTSPSPFSSSAEIRGEVDHVFETRLADLDLKHAHPEKVPKWKETEKALVEEGWYTNTERNAIREEVCVLSREMGIQEVESM